MPRVRPVSTSRPDEGFVPLQPGPLARQDVASVLDQSRVTEAPGATTSEFKYNATVGGGTTCTMVDAAPVPPGPVHFNA